MEQELVMPPEGSGTRAYRVPAALRSLQHWQCFSVPLERFSFHTFLFPGQTVYTLAGLCLLCVISTHSFKGREGMITILSFIRPLCVLSFVTHPLPPQFLLGRGGQLFSLQGHIGF